MCNYHNNRLSDIKSFILHLKNAEDPASTPTPMAVQTTEAKPEKPSASELRVAQYEKPLTKGHRPKTLRGGDRVILLHN